MPKKWREHPRKSPRLKGYDYSQDGAYFVTICTHQREFLFGDVVDGEMQLNSAGEIAAQSWDDLPHHYAHLCVEYFVVMPNHTHAVLIIDRTPPVGAGLRTAPTTPSVNQKHGLTEFIRAYKSFSARKINLLDQIPGRKIWQRSFHDRIIRNEREYWRIVDYVESNPQRWQDDVFYEQSG